MRLPKFDIEGHVHFATTNVARRCPLFVGRELAQIVVDNLHFYAEHLKYELWGYVVMPDHVHALIQPHDRTPISKIMQSLKKRVAREVIEQLLAGAKLDLLHFPPELEPVRRDKARCLAQSLPTLDAFQIARPRTETHRYQIWQAGFYDFNVYTEGKLSEKLNYIHENPVRWGLAETPAQYPFSSYRRWHDE